MSVVIRLKVPIEMHYTVIPMGTSKVNSSPNRSMKLSITTNFRQSKTICGELNKPNMSRTTKYAISK